MTLLDRVKELCKENKISQRKLEKDLDLGNGASSKWGKSSPSADLLQKLADYFGVSSEYLLGSTDFKEKNTENNLSEIIHKNKITTIAAHFEGEDFTDDDVEDIENFIKFVLSKKKK